MSSSSDFELIHGQLHVTKDASKPEALGRSNRSIHGAAYLQGPVQFGNDKTFHPDIVPPLTAPIPKPEGSVMIGPLNNSDSPFPKVNCTDKLEFVDKWQVNPCNIEGIGAEKYEKKLAIAYPLVVRAGNNVTDTGASGEWTTQSSECGKLKPGITKVTSEAAAIFIGDVDIYGYFRVKDRISIGSTADFYDDIVIRQDVIVGADVVAEGNITASGDVKSQCGGHILSAKKNFDIPHPTKKGHRLRHTCPEAPYNDVYIRGKVTSKNEIDLPEYWIGLVDHESITVNLTPIGAHQDVIVKRIDERKVYLQSKGGMPINCFYHIFAERKDGEKLIPEYKGNSPADYPGNNSEYSISGYHYDVKE